MRHRTIAILGAIQLGLAMCCGAAWIWASAWRSGSVREMADQLVIDRVIAETDAASLRARHGSLGAYLEQGWGMRESVAAGGLLIVAIAGGVGMVLVGTKGPVGRGTA